MAASAQSKVKLLIEIAEIGSEKIDAIRKQFADLGTAAASITGSASGVKAQVASTEQLARARGSAAKATKDLSQAERGRDVKRQTQELSAYSQVSAEDLRVQQQRLKQALLYKREAKDLAERLAAQTAKTREQAQALKDAEKAQREAAKAAAQTAKDQERLQKAIEAANQKIIQQAVALDQLKQASAAKLADAIAKADAAAQKQAEQAASKRVAVEEKLAAALAKQKQTADDLKKKTQEAAEAEKQHARQMQAVLKESLKKKRALAQLTEEMERLRRKMKEAEKDNNSFVDGLESAATTAALLQGPLGGVASRISALTQILKDTNPVMAATVLTMGALATGFGASILKAGQTEAQLLKLNAIIKATGGAAGFTTGQVNDMAKALASSNLGDAAEARDAIAKLLTFKGIQDDNFQRAVVVLGDMAAVFGSLDEASVQLGKALEDPIQGLGSLREIGVSVTEEQQNMIKELQRSGNLWLAQKEVMAILEGQIGGAGAAAGGGLIGAMERLTERFSSLMTRIGEGKPLQTATFLFNQLANAIQNLENIITGSSIDRKMVDIAAQADVVRGKLKDIATGKLDASAKEALEAQLVGLQKQEGQLRANTKMLERRIELEEQIKATEAQIAAASRTGVESQNRFVSLLKTGQAFLKGDKLSVLTEGFQFVRGDEKQKLADLKEELAGLSDGLRAYDKTVKEVQTAGAAAQSAVQRAQGLKQQEAQLQALTTLQKRFDREYLQVRQRTLDAETDAAVNALEEQFRQKNISLNDFITQRTALERKQADQQRALLASEVTDLEKNYKDRLDTIRKTNEQIAKSGGLPIKVNADEEAIRTLQQLRVAKEDLARFELDTADKLTKIDKTRREEEEKIANEAKQNAREASQDARRAQREAEALAKTRADAEELLRKAILERRALELDGAGAIEARMQLAADQVVESFTDARQKIVAALGEGAALEVDKLIDTKSVTAQFDALEQIYQERLSRLSVQVTNLQAMKDMGKINYQDFVAGAATAYAAADQELVKLIERMKQLAETSGSSELKSKLMELETQFATTQLAAREFTVGLVDTLSNASADIAQSGFQSFFDSLFNDITDLQGAFQSLAVTILSEMSKVISSRIAAEFASMIGNAFSSSGGGSSGGGSSWIGTAVSAVGAAFGSGGGFATGGYVRGPGTTKSDSIRAWLSDKEFVTNADATQHYGVDVMHAINSKALDRNALRSMIGGTSRKVSARVPRSPRFSEGGAVNVALQAQASQGAGAPVVVPAPNVYNVIDSVELLAKALGRPEGSRTLLTYMRQNGKDILNVLPKNK